MTLPGLEWPVEVIRDRWGVPHIVAESTHDVFLAQGYVMAQDRFWQLELGRRVARGRLSEMVGAVALDTDRFLRRLGLDRLAAAEEARLGPAEHAALTALTAGINAYLDQNRWRLPPEFLILNLSRPRFRPEPWQIRDSLAFGKYLAWIMATNWDNEAIRGQLIAELGFEGLAAIDPAGAALRAAGPPPDLDYAQVDWDFGLVGAGGSPVGAVGQSNNWAIAASRTTSGAALLANDPHLRPVQPVAWYEIHLRAGDFEVAGAAVPGIPGVVIGHNRRIAWGVTASMADVQDLVVQEIDPADPLRYRTAAGWRTADRIVESIRVAGRALPVDEVVRLTEAGPLLNPLRTPSPRYQVALRSAVLQPANLAGALLALNQASDWAEFRAALAGWDAPSLSFVYADVEGSVGYQLTGWIPQRGPADRAPLPVPGWRADYAWAGRLPFDELPSEFNPPAGFTATANHQLVGPDYPAVISHDWTDPARIERIRTRLSNPRPLSRLDCRDLQLDCESALARDLIRRLDGFEPSAGAEVVALGLLRDWDGRVVQRSAGAAVYEVFRHHLLVNLLAARVSEQLRDHYLGRGLHPVLNPVTSTPARFTGLLQEHLAAARAAGWPAAQRAAISRSLRETIADLSARLGREPRRWEWGALHQLTFRHAFGDRPLLDRFFNIGPTPFDGGSESVVQSAVDHWDPFAASGWAPSYRLIVDLGDFDRSISVLPTGQSGHPLSRHYRDQHALFTQGQYHQMPFSATAVERAAVARLQLVP